MGRGIKYLSLAAIISVALLMRLHGLANPLLDNQAWRQADTAGMATHMLGRLTVFPAVFIPYLNYDGVTAQPAELEFPFLPYLTAWTWTIMGRADRVARLWAVGFSMLTLIGIYYLARRIFNERVGLIGMAIYALLPLAVYYGRVVMPEPVAQAFTVWALAVMWRWRSKGQTAVERRWSVPLIPALIMAGAILAKLPQVMVFPVAVVMGFWPGRRPELRHVPFYCLVALGIPLLYYVWIHAGTAQLSRFASGILSNQVLSNPNSDWHDLSINARAGLTFIVPVLAMLGTARLWWTGNPARVWLSLWGLISLFYIGLVCVRIPLDYYVMPVLPLVCILAAYALDFLDDVPRTVSTWLVLCLVWFASYSGLAGKYTWDPRLLVQANWVAAHTSRQSVLVLSDPQPMTFYYAGRVGFRLRQPDDAGALAELSRLPGQYLVMLPDSPRQAMFRKYVTQFYPEIGPGVYELGRSAGG